MEALLDLLLRAIRPVTRVALITPNDGADLANDTTAISFSGAGTLAIVTVGGDSVTIPDGALAVGAMHPIQVRRVLATGTTATGIVGYW